MQFDDLFYNNLETLHAYFTNTIQLHPSAYLDKFLKSLYATHMPLEILCRVWDIFAFEGDIILLRVAVAVLWHFEMKLYVDRDEVLRTLTIGEWDLGNEEVFMKKVAMIQEK
jgi:Rab-GTPase-TBC domain